jgi:hypothetical protein
MKVHRVEYPTEPMARAFMQGIEFAGDDYVSAHEPRQEGEKWVVYVHLWNHDAEAEDICRACVDSYEKLHGKEAAREFAKLLSDEARAAAEDADLGGPS